MPTRHPPQEPHRQGSGHPVFAMTYGWMAASMERGPIGRARHELLAAASGEVVDLGAGIGLNLPHLGAAVTAVHLVEPDPHMIRRLEQNLPQRAVIHPIGAEDLPFADESVDTVLATLTLCTVGDLAGAVAQIRRVLRPDGQLLVLEHVRSLDPAVARWQDRLQRPWSCFAAGCAPNRDTATALSAAGFDTGGLRRFRVPGTLLAKDWLTGRLS